jgi:hypothetical protein
MRKQVENHNVRDLTLRARQIKEENARITEIESMNTIRRINPRPNLSEIEGDHES